MNRGICVTIMSFILIIGVYVAACMILPKLDKTAHTDVTDNSDTQGFTDNAADYSKYTIVVDAGHGGVDPGTVSVNGANEKDINLSIALKLQSLLEGKGFKVVMIRTEDIGLYEETDSNKKSSDMRKRVDIINNSGAQLAVSIHQNSYAANSSVKGFQAMYHNKSAKAKCLATRISESYERLVSRDNLRNIQTDNSLYLLKNTTIPVSIVECGFLTNLWEASKLEEEEYQRVLAQVVCDGITGYFSESQTQR